LSENDLPNNWQVKTLISGYRNKSILDDFPNVVDIAIEEYISSSSDAQLLGRSLHAIYSNYATTILGLIEYGWLNTKDEIKVTFMFRKWRPRIFITNCPNQHPTQNQKVCHYVYQNGTVISRLDIFLGSIDGDSSNFPILFQQRIDEIIINN
jgi:hypothetical protein